MKLNKRDQFGKVKRIVVKIGSALLTSRETGLNVAAIESWVEQMAQLRQMGKEVVLVSSGAVAEGMQRLKWHTRPRALHELQAAAAVGQMGLVRTWETAFSGYGLHTAQVLLTHDDLGNRCRYLNSRSTLMTLLRLGVIPVVNENDTVSTKEITLGDNDTLAAAVSSLVEADLLLILTDQLGVYDKDPRLSQDARLINEAIAGDKSLKSMAGAGGALGRGGMISKVEAARKAANAGTVTVIAPGRETDVLPRLIDGEEIGTVLWARTERITARKQWLANQMQVRGSVVLDEGAARVLREAGKSLLPIGVTEVHGKFSRGDLVQCLDPEGSEVARGLVNYSHKETRQIMRQPSNNIESVLGYVDEPELIHRDNLILT